MWRAIRGRLVLAVCAISVCALCSGCVVSRYTFQADTSKQSITVWSYVNDPVLVPALNAIWQQEHPNVAVRQDFIDLNELGPKEVAAAATGTGPDVIIGNPVVDYPLVQGGGAYANITKQVDASDIRAQYPRYGLWTTKGQIYALQWRFNNLGLWYNSDLLHKYGLTVPKTVPEMERDMAIAKQKSHGQTHGIAVSADASVQSAWQMMTWLLGNGVNYCQLGNAQTVKTLAMLQSWKAEGYTSPDIAAEGMEDVFLDFLRGDYLFAEGGNWEVGTVKESPPKFRFGTAEIPAGTEGSFTSFAGESVALGAHSHNKALAWDYIKSVYLSPAGQTVTYVDSGGLPPRIDTRQTHAVQSVKLSQPFLAELTPSRLKSWPDNTRTLDAQNDVGTVWSDFMSGALTPQQAAAQMRAKVRTDFSEGTGGC